jgi:hypothetical protein
MIATGFQGTFRGLISTGITVPIRKAVEIRTWAGQPVSAPFPPAHLSLDDSYAMFFLLFI